MFLLRTGIIICTLLFSGCSLMPQTSRQKEVLNYRCGTMPLTVELDNIQQQVKLILDGSSRTLRQVISASGARYEDDSYVFWMKGDSAFVERDDKIIIDDCELSPNQVRR